MKISAALAVIPAEQERELESILSSGWKHDCASATLIPWLKPRRV